MKRVFAASLAAAFVALTGCSRHDDSQSRDVSVSISSGGDDDSGSNRTAGGKEVLLGTPEDAQKVEDQRAWDKQAAGIAALDKLAQDGDVVINVLRSKSGGDQTTYPSFAACSKTVIAFKNMDEELDGTCVRPRDGATQDYDVLSNPADEKTDDTADKGDDADDKKVDTGPTPAQMDKSTRAGDKVYGTMVYDGSISHIDYPNFTACAKAIKAIAGDQQESGSDIMCHRRRDGATYRLPEPENN